MKLFTGTLTALALATSATAGNLVLEAPVEEEVIVEETAPMGGSNAAWIVPLIAIAVIAIAASNADDDEPDRSPSDRNLKTDITRTGTTQSGIPVYSFRYTGSDTLFSGVMAQDVLNHTPDAVSVHPLGFYQVNYALIDAEFLRLN